MTIFNLGSINADHVYRVPHLPRPGETLAATGYSRGPGGKGANQSVAAARAGARVVHIGAVGADGGWLVAGLHRAGVDTDSIATVEAITGHAIVTVDDAGENAIVIHPGANRALGDADVAAALGPARRGDWLLMQNETSGQVAAARIAHERGLRIAYSAAPFEGDTVRAVLPYAGLILLNAGEVARLENEMGGPPPGVTMVVTRGADGAEWRPADGGPTLSQPAFAVTPRDTTGAGDCFAGTLVAALSRGAAPRDALRLAVAAAAIQVTRPGASAAMPTATEVARFLWDQE